MTSEYLTSRFQRSCCFCSLACIHTYSRSRGKSVFSANFLGKGCFFVVVQSLTTVGIRMCNWFLVFSLLDRLMSVFDCQIRFMYGSHCISGMLKFQECLYPLSLFLSRALFYLSNPLVPLTNSKFIWRCVSIVYRINLFMK